MKMIFFVMKKKKRMTMIMKMMSKMKKKVNKFINIF